MDGKKSKGLINVRFRITIEKREGNSTGNAYKSNVLGDILFFKLAGKYLGER